MNDDERIVKLENRVAKLEEELARLRDSRPNSIQKIDKTISTNPKPILKKESDWEKKIGQVWLPRIFIFVLLLGVIWGFKAGSELGLINNFVRIGTGYFAGCLILLIGHRQWQRKNLVLSQVLIGGAVAIFFLTTFAAHVLYDLIPISIAFSIHIVVVLLGMLLTKYHQSQSIGIVSSVGALLVPFLLQSESGNILFFALYELVIFIAFMVLALTYRLKVLYLVVTYGMHLSFLIFALIQWNTDIQALAWAVMIQHIIIIIYFLYRQTLKKQVAFTVLTSSVLMSLWILTTFTHSSWLLLFIFAYLLCTGTLKMETNKRSVFLSSAALTLLLFLLDLFDQAALGVFLVIEGSIVLYLSYQYQSYLQRWIGFGIYSLGVLSIIVYPIEQLLSIETLAWTLLMFSFILHFKFNQNIRRRNDIVAIIKIGINFLGLIYLSQLTLLMTNYVDFKSMVLSVTWIVYAAANVLYGHSKQDKLFRLFGVFLIFFTLLKVTFIDLPTVSILIRAILFLLLGGMGLAVSRLFYKKETDRTEK